MKLYQTLIIWFINISISNNYNKKQIVKELTNQYNIGYFALTEYFEKYKILKIFIKAILDNHKNLDKTFFYTNEISERFVLSDYEFIINHIKNNTIKCNDNENQLLLSYKNLHKDIYLQSLNDKINNFILEINKLEINKCTNFINFINNKNFYSQEEVLLLLFRANGTYMFFLISILSLYINPQYKEDLFKLLNCHIDGNYYDNIPTIVSNNTENYNTFTDYVMSSLIIIDKIYLIFQNKESDDYKMLLKIFNGVDFQLLEIIINNLRKNMNIIDEISESINFLNKNYKNYNQECQYKKIIEAIKKVKISITIIFEKNMEMYEYLQNFIKAILDNHKNLDKIFFYSYKISERCIMYDYNFIMDNIKNNKIELNDKEKNLLLSYEKYDEYNNSLQLLKNQLNNFIWELQEYENNTPINPKIMPKLYTIYWIASTIVLLTLSVYINPQDKKYLFKLLNCYIEYENDLFYLMVLNDEKDRMKSAFEIILKMYNIFNDKKSDDYKMFLKIFNGIDLQLLEEILHQLHFLRTFVTPLILGVFPSHYIKTIKTITTIKKSL